jgi:pimeloyl-ACP methyl ester carboxylesterase
MQYIGGGGRIRAMFGSMETEKLNQQFKLADGRQIGFAEFGHLDGKPLLYFHGWPSSRLEPRTGQNICSGLGVRMIAADRPGYGLSDFKARTKITDWLSDLQQLIQHLGLKRFSVMGVSGGGPYAAACAATIPERVSAALLVSSVAPPDAPELTEGMVALHRYLLSFARRTPRLAQCVAGICMRLFWRKGQQVIPEQVETRLPPADQRALASAELRQALTASSMEALRKGVVGAVADGMLYARDWGFKLQDIRMPVHLWQGEKDVIVPPAMGHYLARTIPECRATFYPEDGHFSLAFERLEEILKCGLR